MFDKDCSHNSEESFQADLWTTLNVAIVGLPLSYFKKNGGSAIMNRINQFDLFFSVSR
jgi:hypothetical protein